MKKTLLLFFTVSLLGLGNITAMNPKQARVNSIAFRVIQDKAYYPYMDELKSKTADQLKEMLQDLILQDFNRIENFNTVANKITLVMGKLDQKNPNITFTQDDIQLLSELRTA